MYPPDMTVTRCCGPVLLLVVAASGMAAPTSEPSAQTRLAKTGSPNRQILERVRKQTPGRTPARFNAIPDRLADILVEKHLYKNGEVWGLAKTLPDQGHPYDEMGSSTFAGLVKQYLESPEFSAYRVFSASALGMASFDRSMSRSIHGSISRWNRLGVAIGRRMGGTHSSRTYALRRFMGRGSLIGQ
ncbi:MAG: hypothetical protein ACUVXJ_12825 [Phycisphaerae bacterium]